MINVYSDNTHAITCYKNVGFTEFGRHRESVFKNGRYVDDAHMDILATEFSKENS